MEKLNEPIDQHTIDQQDYSCIGSAFQRVRRDVERDWNLHDATTKLGIVITVIVALLIGTALGMAMAKTFLMLN
jgi:hypothetical protein